MNVSHILGGYTLSYTLALFPGHMEGRSFLFLCTWLGTRLPYTYHPSLDGIPVAIVSRRPDFYHTMHAAKVSATQAIKGDLSQ